MLVATTCQNKVEVNFTLNNANNHQTSSSKILNGNSHVESLNVYIIHHYCTINEKKEDKNKPNKLLWIKEAKREREKEVRGGGGFVSTKWTCFVPLFFIYLIFLYRSLCGFHSKFFGIWVNGFSFYKWIYIRVRCS